MYRYDCPPVSDDAITAATRAVLLAAAEQHGEHAAEMRRLALWLRLAAVRRRAAAQAPVCATARDEARFQASEEEQDDTDRQEVE